MTNKNKTSKVIPPKDQSFLIQAWEESNELFETVLSQLDLPENDDVLRQNIKKSLEDEATEHIEFTMWQNLSDAQAIHLREFIDQRTVTDPDMPLETVMLDFLSLYEDLRQKVFASLAQFLSDFIKGFNS